MIRSFIAVIIATIIGLTAAKFVEGAGQAAAAGPDGAYSAASAAYQGALIAGWGVGAFAAGLVAMLIGGRWAPLGGLAAGTIFLAAVIALLSAPFSWYALPGAAGATALGGFCAVKLLGAGLTLPSKNEKLHLFDD